MRKPIEKPRCGGLWTEAKYKAFIKNALRMASMKWGPIGQCSKEARVSRGMYTCASCLETVPSSIKVEGQRKKKRNIKVDHIEPVICPIRGFVSWDEVVSRMFVEKEGLQLLCSSCHDIKTKEEREIRKNNKK